MSEAAALQTQTAKAPLSNSHSLLVQRKCACGGSSGLTGSCSGCENKKLLGHRLQAKLRISEPDDEYEQEADRVGEQVIRMPDPVSEEHIGRGTVVSLVQRTAHANVSEIGTAPPIVHDVLTSAGQPLEATTRAFFESRFGHNFSQVRVHTDARAAESARAVNALAYTVGPNVVFGVGQYAPKTRVGQQLMAHELTHVVQQGNGPAIFEGNRIFGTVSDTSEREADEVAQNIASFPVRRTARVVTRKPILQRKCGKALGAPNPDCYPSSDNVSGEIFYFDVNCDDLKPGEAEHAKKFFSELRPGSMLSIHGFASMEGLEAFNWDLSCHRANKIRSLWNFAMPVVSGIPPPSVFKHGPTQNGPAFFWRSVIVEVIPPANQPPTGCKIAKNPDLWGSTYNPTTDNEVENAMKNPFGALEADHARDNADSDAAASGLPGRYYGPRDAFRHCDWSCLMAQALGDAAAEQFATAHENSGPSSIPWNNEMDLHNNAIGRSSEAAQWLDCVSFCLYALESGLLRTIRGPEADKRGVAEGLPPSSPPVLKTCIGASDQPWP